MMVGRNATVEREIGVLFGAGTTAGLSDEELLGRFVGRRDAAGGAAFEAIVRRHGPMVLATCRRLLREPADAADAFQATFLVLASRAGSVRRSASLGPWLHRVARHAALRARLRSGRRRQREQIAAVAESQTSAHEASAAEGRELRVVLDEELDRLPRSFRAPLVLCYLEGLTHDEAAARLGCPVGTVRSRLARGRDRLRDRLARRGLAPTVVATVALAAPKSAPAALPAPLVGPTVQAAALLAGGDRVAARLLAGPAFSLMEGVIGAMLRDAIGKIVAAAVVAVAGLIPLAVVAPRAIGAGRSESAGQDKTKEKAKAKEKESRGDWGDLVGRWDLVSVTNSGKKVESKDAGFNECLILAPKADAKTGTGAYGWFILLLDNRLFCELEVKERDLDAKPKTLNLFTVRNIQAGKDGKPSEFPMDYEAVFRLVGDELTVCLGKPNGTRPDGFEAEEKSGRMLVKFRRRPKDKGTR
ncbi:MAG TPA: sigma-70 family RNA polymerase sigma factor [Isosphaeraceae bacterium]|jgi:RNA polymerase sigma factor (sigma-70 family)|nr:sigma-70 family RNA polymerase sigma factor [Isosphaeraceae bacterium]